MPIKATLKLLRRTLTLCAALSFSSLTFAADTLDFHRWDGLVNSSSPFLFYKTEAQLNYVTCNNTGSSSLHGKFGIKKETLTWTYVATADTGYHFAHWSCTPTELNLETVIDKSGVPFCYGHNPELVFYLNKSTVDTKSFKINLCPLFEPNEYLIKFDANGGTGTMDDLSMSYDAEKNLTANAFTKKGYSLDFWLDSETQTSYRDQQAVKNLTDKNGVTITLTAQWTNNVYTVSFDTRGGSTATSILAQYDLAYNETKRGSFPGDPIKAGYNFMGWTLDSNATVGNVTGDTKVDIAEDHTIYATWQAIPYSVTLDLDGGVDGSTNVTTTFGSPMPSIMIPSKVGYTFGGYYTSKNGLGTKYYNADGSSAREWDRNPYNYADTLYAHWIGKTCTVTFDPGEGTIAADKVTKEVQYNTQYGALPTPDDRHGYDFIGWNLEAPNHIGLIYPSTYVPVSTNHIVTATWKAKAEYTVSFDACGGEAIDPKKYIGDYTYGDRGLPEPVKTGYTFVKWHYKDSEEAVTEGSPMLKKDHTLYAAWQANVYLVTFDIEGETYETINEAYDATYTLPTPNPEKSGYTFLGWYTAVEGGEEVTAETIVAITSATTLYAQWSANKYKIVFDKNHSNAVAAPSPVTVEFDVKYALPDFAAKGEAHPNPSYRFVGWKHDPKDETAPLPAGTEVSMLSTGDDYTFYAIWELDLNDLSAAAHCKNAEVASEDWEIVEGDPTSIRSRISAIGGNADHKGLTLAIRGSGTLHFLAKRSDTMSDNLSLHLRGKDDGKTKDETIETAANWQSFSFSLKNVTEDFSLEIDYNGDGTIPFLPTNENHRYYLDDIVWVPEGESYEESREKFEVTVTVTNFASWSSIPSADAAGVIHVYEGDSVKVWGTPKKGYATSYTSEETAFVLSSVKKNETIVLSATQAVQLSDLAKAANCKNIDISSSTNGGCWTKCTLDGSVGIWSAPTNQYTYNDDLVLTAEVPGAGTLSFDWKTTEEMSSPYLTFEYRKGGSGKWTTISAPKNVSAEYTTISLTFTEATKFEWRATITTTSKTATPSETNNRFFLNNIKWLAEGEEDTPEEKTELEKWAELLGCAATEEAVAAKFKEKCKLTISFDEFGKPLIGVTGIDAALIDDVKIECREDLSNPTEHWIEHDPAQHSDCRFYRGTLDLGL